MLQAQGLSVEVGGRLVVESADFTVMPRDKVGLVGRNGAGKTSLFRVLGGESEPAAGRVIRKGGFGYLPQDPRIAGVLDGRTAVSHILSGRGIDAEMERMEKLRIAMEERPDERNVSRFTRAEEQFRTTGGYGADSEARAMAAGLGIGPDRIESADRGALRRRAAAGRAVAHPVRRQRRAVPRRADQPPRRRRQGVADGVPADATAAPCSSSATTSTCSTRRSPASSTSTARTRRPPATSSSTRARTRSTSRRGPPTRPTRQAGGPAGQGDRPDAAVRRPLRGQGQQGLAGPQHGEADHPAGGREGRRAPGRRGCCG